MIKDFISKFDIYIAWIFSIFATLGSLYFSEVLHFIPCTLCWFQRILMYPLVIILGISVLKRDYNINTYVLPLSTLGIIVSFYHYSLQKIPGFSGIHICSTGIPCNGEYINLFGFVTIPFLALLGFVFIFIILLLGKVYRTQR